MWISLKLYGRLSKSDMSGAKCSFDADTCAVLTCIDEQSSDIIALGVDKALEAKFGSAPLMLMKPARETKGMMFGFALAMKPGADASAHSLAHKLAYPQLTRIRKEETEFIYGRMARPSDSDHEDETGGSAILL